MSLVNFKLALTAQRRLPAPLLLVHLDVSEALVDDCRLAPARLGEEHVVVFVLRHHVQTLQDATVVPRMKCPFPVTY